MKWVPERSVSVNATAKNSEMALVQMVKVNFLTKICYFVLFCHTKYPELLPFAKNVL